LAAQRRETFAGSWRIGHRYASGTRTIANRRSHTRVRNLRRRWRQHDRTGYPAAGAVGRAQNPASRSRVNVRLAGGGIPALGGLGGPCYPPLRAARRPQHRDARICGRRWRLRSCVHVVGCRHDVVHLRPRLGGRRGGAQHVVHRHRRGEERQSAEPRPVILWRRRLSTRARRKRRQRHCFRN